MALLFLVKDQIHTEPLWAAFIASAAELTLRKNVPPTRPNPPDLFPKISPIKEEMKTTCWKHGGVAVPLVVPPRERYDGARSRFPPLPLSLPRVRTPTYTMCERQRCVGIVASTPVKLDGDRLQ